MTIDEAIAHAREIETIHRNNDKLNKTLGDNSPYYNLDCLKYAEEYEQLAEWLEELKMYKSLAPKELVSQKQRNDRNAEYNKGFNDGYNNAIYDFVEKATEEQIQYDCPLDMHDIEKIAEKLKGNNAENY